jgi:hypothetical protein
MGNVHLCPEKGPTWQFMLGYFDSNKTMLLVNQDSNHPALASLGFAQAAVAAYPMTSRLATPVTSLAMMEVDPVTGDVKPALDDSPFLAGFQASAVAADITSGCVALRFVTLRCVLSHCVAFCHVAFCHIRLSASHANV